jgi:accessory colonization factor AcfC
LDKILKKAIQAARLPRCVAFGSTFDTFFVVFNDGSWQYQGRGIPETLEEKLKDRKERADIVTVNLGPNGEWFLKAENGRMWWSGITQELDGVLSKILQNGYLHSMDFGENGSYFVTYDNE